MVHGRTPAASSREEEEEEDDDDDRNLLFSPAIVVRLYLGGPLFPPSTAWVGGSRGWRARWKEKRREEAQRWWWQQQQQEEASPV